MDVPTSPADPSPPETPDPPVRPLPLKRRAREEQADIPGPDAEILALAGRLQDLIGRRREQDTTQRDAASPRENRLRPRLPATPANPDEEVLAVLAEVRAASGRRGPDLREPSAEAQLEALAGRWLRGALWPGACVLVGLLTFAAGKHFAAPAPPPVPVSTGAPPLVRTDAPGSAGAPGTSAETRAAASAPRWSEKSLAALDDILSARRAGDPARAGSLARVLRTEAGALPGLDLFLGENLLHGNRPSEATTALLGLMRADPPQAAAIARLGFIAARQRQLDEAAGYYAAACAADPFRGDLFYRWAETLRRQGKSAEAVNRFNQASLRPADDEGARPAPPDTAFRRRLARLEAGDINPVRQETAAALSAPANAETGRWLLTAAALELLDKHPAPAVTAALARARAALPVNEWDRLSGDLFFRGYADRHELAEYLPPAGSPADARRVATLSMQPDLDFIDP